LSPPPLLLLLLQWRPARVQTQAMLLGHGREPLQLLWCLLLIQLLVHLQMWPVQQFLGPGSDQGRVFYAVVLELSQLHDCVLLDPGSVPACSCTAVLLLLMVP
jgi:hypothetical protein